jgi:hypothetical protein
VYVKKAILNAYQLVPEAYRQKFRNLKKTEEQTYVEFSKEKERLFDRWCHSTEVDKDFDKLKQLILLEEFKQCAPREISTYLDEHKASNLNKAAELADDFALTHKRSFNQATAKPFIPNEVKSYSKEPNQGLLYSAKQKSSSEPKQGLFSKPLQCAYCKKKGHLISNCSNLKKKNSATNAVVVQSPIDESHELKKQDPPKEFQPFIFQGTVSLPDRFAAKSIQILRDTGASITLLKQGTLPLSTETAKNETIVIRGVEGGFVQVPLHEINLNCDLVSGPVTVGLIESLPVQGVSMLLANDIAGGTINKTADARVSKNKRKSIKRSSDVQNGSHNDKGFKAKKQKFDKSQGRSDSNQSHQKTAGKKKSVRGQNTKNKGRTHDEHYDLIHSIKQHYEKLRRTRNFLNKMKNKNQRLLRWAIALQKYNLLIRHVKDKDNVIADSLSRTI